MLTFVTQYYICCTTTMTNVLIHCNLSIPNDGCDKMLTNKDHKSLWYKIKMKNVTWQR